MIMFFKIISSYHSSCTSKFANHFSLDCVESVHPFKPSENQIIFIDVLWFLLNDVELWWLEEILHKYLPLFLFGLGSQHTFKKKCYHTDYWYYQVKSNSMVINNLKYHTCELYLHLEEVESSNLLHALVWLLFHLLHQWNETIFEVRKETFWYLKPILGFEVIERNYGLL